MMKTATVGVVGSANLDVVVTTDRIPAPGETVLGHRLQRFAGGKGANQAVAAAKAGGADTTFFALVGADAEGEFLREAIARGGVATDQVATGRGATGTALISVDARGENAIVVIPGANAELTTFNRTQRERLAGADVVLAQLEVPIAGVVAAAECRRPGAQLILNAAPAERLPAELWRQLDVLIVNEHEAIEVAGVSRGAGVEAAAAVLAARVPLTVVTLGARGALLVRKGQGHVHIPAREAEVVDTTGAGDVFCGVFAAGLAHGATAEAAAGAACVAAALAVGRMGAQEGTPTLAEVRRALGRDPW